jgi:hypothetical protein
MADSVPLYVYPAYDGDTDTTTWHGYVLTEALRYTTSKPSREAVIAQLTHVLRRETGDAGPVQVIERPWRKGHP